MAIGRVDQEKRQCRVRITDIRQAGAETCISIAIFRPDVLRLILHESKVRSIAARGYRVGKAPVGNVYRSKPALFNSLLLDQARTSPNEKLKQILKTSLTPPEYMAEAWDGLGDFNVEIRYFSNPASFKPGGRYTGIAEPGGGNVPNTPQPGGISIDNFMPSQTLDLNKQGIQTGMQLSQSQGFNLIASNSKSKTNDSIGSFDPTPQVRDSVPVPDPIGAGQITSSPRVAEPTGNLPCDNSKVDRHVKADLEVSSGAGTVNKQNPAPARSTSSDDSADRGP